MKKLISSILVIVMVLFVPFALADIDISGLSYKELVELVDRAQRQIMFSDYWQEVEVPIGRYIVGTDIPVGKWTVSAKSGTYTCVDQQRVSIDEFYKTERYDYISSFQLYSKDFNGYTEAFPTSAPFELQEGDIFNVTYGTAIFTPYQGLGFKFN